MTYSPSAYPLLHDGKWWICLITPSGLKARLSVTYRSQAHAEGGICAYGFKQIAPPKHDDISAAAGPSVATDGLRQRK